MVLLMVLLGTTSARAQSVLPKECAGATQPVKAVQRTSKASYKRVYFYNKPVNCPLSVYDSHDPHSPLPGCEWRRNAYVVKGDVVREVAQTERFVCATFGKTTGWMPTMDLCLSPKPRQLRSEPSEIEDDSHIPCSDYVNRTITKDEVFFGGTFKADNGEVMTELIAPGKVRYTIALADDSCRVTMSGTADVKGTNAVDEKGTTFAFSDTGLDIKMGSRSPCPNVTKEFYFDPGGSQLVVPAPGSSGCDLDVPGLDKDAVVKLYYRLKRAVAQNDQEAVATMVKYPLRAYAQGKKVGPILNSKAFVSKYDLIVNSCMKADLEMERISRVFCRDQGLMLGGGEIWISGDASDPKIVTFNIPGCSSR